MFGLLQMTFGGLRDPSKLFLWRALSLGTALIPFWIIWFGCRRDKQITCATNSGGGLDGDSPTSIVPNAVSNAEETKKTRREQRAEATAASRAQEKELREQQKKAKRARRRSEADDLHAKLQVVLAEASRSDSPVTFVAIDVEAWEQDQGKVTEIGLAVARLSSRAVVDSGCPEFSADESCFRHRHFLIKEHLSMRNGRFVEDNKDGFLFGDSELISLDNATRELSAELRMADYIVGQAPQGDLKWLRNIGVTGIGADGDVSVHRVLDTQVLAMAGAPPEVDVLNVSGLKALAERYALNPRNLHNAANDAAFTLQVFLSQLNVSFASPARTPSRHLEAPNFQVAAAEAKDIAYVAQSERLALEEGLRAEVRQFATEAQTSSACIPDLQLERKFPSELSSAQRRIVHEVAEELGLGSRSVTGTRGERCVSIFPQSGTPAPSPGGWHRRHAARRRGGPKAKSGSTGVEHG